MDFRHSVKTLAAIALASTLHTTTAAADTYRPHVGIRIEIRIGYEEPRCEPRHRSGNYVPPYRHENRRDCEKRVCIPAGYGGYAAQPKCRD